MIHVTATETTHFALLATVTMCICKYGYSM